jgi:DNA-binding NtrC family response regulator
MNKETVHLYLVDDDAVFLKSLQLDFLALGSVSVSTFATGELCVAALDILPDLIILDYHLDGIDKSAMNGIDTLDKIREISPDMPVVMLSSQDKIEVAVNCMHHKAYDYVVKSETAFMRLQKIIETIKRYRKVEKQLSWYMERM